MYVEPPEEDWKRIRSLKDRALEKACSRVLGEVSEIAKSRDPDSHTVYLHLWKILQHEDHDIELMLNDLKRSTALFQLASWYKNGVISENDLQGFTEETRNIALSMGHPTH